MESADVPLRWSRQASLVPPDRIRSVTAFVVGCGAVGRQVAQLLAAMGVGKLVLLDQEFVGEENLAPQLYRGSSLGRCKAEETQRHCQELNGDISIEGKCRRFGKADHKLLKDAWVFACADHMTARRNIWEACVKGGARWFGDARCAGETLHIFAEDKLTPGSRYAQPDILFPQSAAHVGTCTTRMTAGMAMMTAGHLVTKFTQYLRGVKSGFTEVLYNAFYDEVSSPSERYHSVSSADVVPSQAAMPPGEQSVEHGVSA